MKEPALFYTKLKMINNQWMVSWSTKLQLVRAVLILESINQKRKKIEKEKKRKRNTHNDINLKNQWTPLKTSRTGWDDPPPPPTTRSLTLLNLTLNMLINGHFKVNEHALATSEIHLAPAPPAPGKYQSFALINGWSGNKIGITLTVTIFMLFYPIFPNHKHTQH